MALMKLFSPPTPWKPDGSDGIEKADAEVGKLEEKLSDSTKLKGILWPGMDLFDSATPEMKRMRNQRKDSSILDQMKATSTEVEPTEVVYHPDGKVSHSRDIFGPLSTENSPVSSQRLAVFANAVTDFCRVKSTILLQESASLARLRHYLTSVSMPPAFEHHDPRRTLLLERHWRAHMLPCNPVIRRLIHSCKLHLSTLWPALVRDTFQVQRRMKNSA